jgi:hypothetical protein
MESIDHFLSQVCRSAFSCHRSRQETLIRLLFGKAVLGHTDDINPFTPPSGNLCGHDPCAPRWFEPPEKHAPCPAILCKLTEKLQAYYRKPAATLPSLNLAFFLIAARLNRENVPTLNVSGQWQHGTVKRLLRSSAASAVNSSRRGDAEKPALAGRMASGVMLTATPAGPGVAKAIRRANTDFIGNVLYA